MKKRFFVIALIFLMISPLLAGCSRPESQPEPVIISNQQQGISVTGTGDVEAAPDIAMLRLGIQSQEKTVASAQSKAIDAMNKVLSALTANGVATKDIQTQQFSIQVVTRFDNTTQQDIIIGYQVTNVVAAKIRALDNTGTVIDAIVSAGGDLTRVNSINFSIEDPSSLYTQARQKALNDAKAKAEQIASITGVTLGKPIFVSENTSLPIFQNSNAPSPSAIGTPISPGEIDISASVQVVYAIVD